MSFDDDHRFVLNGTGQGLDEFVLFSDAGGLIPSTTGAPFSPLTVGDPSNDADSIKFTSDGSVTIDGAVALDAGWDRNLGFRDIRYSYREHDSGEQFGPYRLPGSVYPRVPPSSNIGVRIDRDDHSFVLTGKGHELKSFEFTSPSESLVPASSTAPFESFTENTPSRVEFITSERVLLDGALKLDVRYDANVAGEDVRYRYSQTGFPEPRGPLEVQGTYPPNPQRSPLLVELGDNKGFQLGGKGQRLTSFTLLSEGGSLVAADDPSPFEFSVVSDTEITLSRKCARVRP